MFWPQHRPRSVVGPQSFWFHAQTDRVISLSPARIWSGLSAGLWPQNCPCSTKHLPGLCEQTRQYPLYSPALIRAAVTCTNDRCIRIMAGSTAACQPLRMRIHCFPHWHKNKQQENTHLSTQTSCQFPALYCTLANPKYSRNRKPGVFHSEIRVNLK